MFNGMREREGKEGFIGKRMEKQQWKRERKNEISMKKRERKNERSQPKREIIPGPPTVTWC